MSDSDEMETTPTIETHRPAPDDPSLAALINPKEDTLTYDLGNLTAYDDVTLDLTPSSPSFSSDLLTYTRHNVQLLINRIFTLPSEDIKGEPGRLAVLPIPTTPLPRAKPMPKPKAPTKWESFAKLKGITKRKKSSTVYDEVNDQWAPRHGYKRVKSADEQNFVLEAKANDDGAIDPWTRMDSERKERVTKNKKQQTNNLMRQAGGKRLPGTLDLAAITPDTAPGKRNQQGKKKEKHHVDVALSVVQKSTASMGKFDQKRESEPEMKTKTIRRDAELASIPNEKKQSMAVFSKLFSGSNAEDHVDVSKAVNFDQQQKEKEKRKRPTKKAPKYGPDKRNKGKAGGGGGDDD